VARRRCASRSRRRPQPTARQSQVRQERKLVVNEAEAATVRYIFRRYLELETVRA